MQQLYFASEVRPLTEVVVPEVELEEAERKLALQLIEQQTTDRSFGAPLPCHCAQELECRTNIFRSTSLP